MITGQDDQVGSQANSVGFHHGHAFEAITIRECAARINRPIYESRPLTSQDLVEESTRKSHATPRSAAVVYTCDHGRSLSVIVSRRRCSTTQNIGSRPSDHYFRSVCLSVCLFVCLFVCAEFFSAVFDPISIKLGHMLYVSEQGMGHSE